MWLLKIKIFSGKGGIRLGKVPFFQNPVKGIYLISLIQERMHINPFDQTAIYLEQDHEKVIPSPLAQSSSERHKGLFGMVFPIGR